MKRRCKRTEKALHAVTQLQPVEKVCFIKIEQILYPFKNALWALRPCKAFGHSISASLPKPQTPFPWKGAILLGLPPLVPVGGYAPQPHFNKLKPLHGVSHKLVAVEDYRERTVIQKLDLHIRTEPACLHIGYAFAPSALLCYVLVQLVCHIG